MKLVIVGGVAGGASAAARARRLDEDAEIVLLERGPEPSFANCGLPYYIGGEIQQRDKLLVATREMLAARHRLDVRVRSEVTAIDCQRQVVQVRELDTSREYELPYDRLILATGAAALTPPMPGVDLPDIYTLRDLPDADRLHAVATGASRHATIVGAGFIGMELAENFVRRRLSVAVVELGEQILAPWDPEMVRGIERHVRQQGVDLRLGDSVAGFSLSDGRLQVELQSGARIATDFAVLAIGVRPENRLAQQAGLECGPRGGVVTNAHMQTSDPHIYAVGDVAQVADSITGQPTQVPLAGPANRQGRIAADHIFGRPSTYRGTQGTAIVGVFGMTAAMTGQSEKLLRRAGADYRKVYVHPRDHAGYYPGSQPLTLKLMFQPDGRILGAQAVGTSGVDKRIDVIAVAIQAGMSVEDLEQCELCYAPQYGSAKDPVNMAGFVASGVVRGDQPVTHVADLGADEPLLVLDVRTPAEFAAGHVPHAVNIPLESLRERLDELPRDQPIVAYCAVGQRGYMATRLLMQRGFRVANLSGGYTTWKQWDD